MESVDKYFEFLHDEHGFTEVENIYDKKHFGDMCIILQSSEMRVKILKDKDQISLDIASVQEPNNWFDINLVNELIEENGIRFLQQNEYAEKETKLVAEKLKYYLPHIQRLFERSNFPKTKEKLTQKEIKRSKKLFGI